ncbi:MAG TPA: acireductone synthase [Pyrinomonadaceae bacterium]|nr:acireductone synthase [Pyrinomonadaceae bacterium]
MTSNLTTARIRSVLLDIEGTTTPISFVHEVLFSFARARLKDYLTRNWESPELAADIAGLHDEHAADVERNLKPPALRLRGEEQIGSVIAYVNWLMDKDRKSTTLKNLQGKIWKQGYLSGTLAAETFTDVAPALERWRKAGLSISIFSSGSVLAQKLLFAHTHDGDLTSLIDNYFDTTTGAKAEPESYLRIAKSLRLPAPEILFISDVGTELAAAKIAGMQTLLCVRPGNARTEGDEEFEAVRSFDGLFS